MPTLMPDTPPPAAAVATEPPIKRLWANLGRKDPKFTVSYDDFVADMQDEDNLRSLHGHLPEVFEGFAVPYDTFAGDMGVKKKAPLDAGLPPVDAGTPTPGTGSTAGLTPLDPNADAEFVSVPPATPLGYDMAQGLNAAPVPPLLPFGYRSTGAGGDLIGDGQIPGQPAAQGVGSDGGSEQAYLDQIPGLANKDYPSAGKTGKENYRGKGFDVEAGNELVEVPNDYRGGLQAGTFPDPNTGLQYFRRPLSNKVDGKVQTLADAMGGAFKNSLYEIGQGAGNAAQALTNVATLPNRAVYNAVGKLMGRTDEAPVATFGDTFEGHIENHKTKLAPLYTQDHNNLNTLAVGAAAMAPMVVSQAIQLAVPEIKAAALLKSVIGYGSMIAFDVQQVHGSRERAKAAKLTGVDADYYTAFDAALTLAGFKVGGKLLGQLGDAAAMKMAPDAFRADVATGATVLAAQQSAALGRALTQAEQTAVLGQILKAKLPALVSAPKGLLEGAATFAGAGIATKIANQAGARALGGTPEEITPASFLGDLGRDAKMGAITHGVSAGISAGANAIGRGLRGTPAPATEAAPPATYSVVRPDRQVQGRGLTLTGMSPDGKSAIMEGVDAQGNPVTQTVPQAWLRLEQAGPATEPTAVEPAAPTPPPVAPEAITAPAAPVAPEPAPIAPEPAQASAAPEPAPTLAPVELPAPAAPAVVDVTGQTPEPLPAVAPAQPATPPAAAVAPSLTIVRHYDAFKRNNAPSSVEQTAGGPKRRWNSEAYTDYMDKSDHTGRKIRWGVELSDGRRVSVESAIQETQPELYQRLKDQGVNFASKAGREELFWALPESEQQAIVDSIPFDEVPSQLKSGRIDSQAVAAYLEKEGHFLTGIANNIGTPKNRNKGGGIAGEINSAIGKWEKRTPAAPKPAAESPAPTPLEAAHAALDTYQALPVAERTGVKGAKARKPLMEAAKAAGLTVTLDGNKAGLTENGKPVKTPKPVAAAGKPANVVNTPIGSITTDEKRFQNRTELNEDIVKGIAERYDPNQMDPVVTWKDPKDGKTYLLAGHHRLEGARRAGVKDIPARPFTGTEAEAVKYARELSNANRSMETPLDRAKLYREKREVGGSKAANLEAAKAAEGKNAQNIIDLSHLNPTGRAHTAYQQMLGAAESASTAATAHVAQMIGAVRRVFPELTNAHENELYDYLVTREKYGPPMKGGKKTGNTNSATGLIEAVRQVVAHPFKAFDPANPLNLAKLEAPKTTAQSEAAADLARLVTEGESLTKRLNELSARPAPTPEMKAVKAKRKTELTDAFMRNREAQNKQRELMAKADAAADQQMGLFDAPNPPAPAVVAIFEGGTAADAAAVEPKITALEARADAATTPEQTAAVAAEAAKLIQDEADNQAQPAGSNGGVETKNSPAQPTGPAAQAGEPGAAAPEAKPGEPVAPTPLEAQAAANLASEKRLGELGGKLWDALGKGTNKAGSLGGGLNPDVVPILKEMVSEAMKLGAGKVKEIILRIRASDPRLTPQAVTDEQLAAVIRAAKDEQRTDEERAARAERKATKQANQATPPRTKTARRLAKEARLKQANAEAPAGMKAREHAVGYDETIWAGLTDEQKFHRPGTRLGNAAEAAAYAETNGTQSAYNYLMHGGEGNMAPEVKDALRKVVADRLGDELAQAGTAASAERILAQQLDIIGQRSQTRTDAAKVLSQGVNAEGAYGADITQNPEGHYHDFVNGVAAIQQTQDRRFATEGAEADQAATTRRAATVEAVLTDQDVAAATADIARQATTGERPPAAAKPGAAPPAADPAGYGASNKLFVKRSTAEIRALFKGLVFSSPLPPELIYHGAYHLEASTRRFADWSKKMLRDVGERVRPRLAELYEASKKEFVSRGGRSAGFDGPDVVEALVREEAAQVLARKVVTAARAVEAPAGVFDPVRAMLDTLLKKVNETLPPGKPKAQTAREAIVHAMQNKAEYADVFEQSKAAAAKLIDGLKITDDAKQKLHETLEGFVATHIGQPFADRQADTVIAAGMKALGQKMEKLVREHADVRNAAKGALIDRLVAEAGLSPALAAEYADLIGKRYAALEAKKAQSMVKRLLAPVKARLPGGNLAPVVKRLVETLDLADAAADPTGATPSPAAAMLAKALRIEDVSVEEAQQFRVLVAAVRAASVGKEVTINGKKQTVIKTKDQQKAVVDLLRYGSQRIKAVSWYDKGRALQYAFRLSGLDTQGRNLGSNVKHTVLEQVFVSPLYNAFANRDPLGAAANLRGYFKGQGNGVAEAIYTMATGYTGNEQEKYGDNSPLETSTNKGLKAAAYVGRAMVAGDQLTSVPTANGRVFELALQEGYRLARAAADPATGAPLNLPYAELRAKAFAHANEVTYNTRQTIADLDVVLENEGLPPLPFANVTRGQATMDEYLLRLQLRSERTADLLRQARTADNPDMMKDADAYTRFQTLNNDPQGVMGKLIDAAQSTKSGNVFIDFMLNNILPFMRVPANSMARKLEWGNPLLTMARVARGRTSLTMGEDSKFSRKLTSEEKYKMTIRAGVGTAGYMALASLVRSGVLIITGPATGDDEDILYPPQSIIFRGEAHSYKDSNFEYQLTVMAAVSAYAKRHLKRGDQPTVNQKIGVAAMHSAAWAVTQGPLGGGTDLAVAMEQIMRGNSESGWRYTKRLLTTAVKTGTLPALPVQAAQTYRDWAGMPQREKRSNSLPDELAVSFFGSLPYAEVGEDRINFAGQPLVLTREGEAVWRDEGTKKLAGALVKWALMPDRQNPNDERLALYDPVDGHRVTPLTDAEFHKYAVLRGQDFTKRMLDNDGYHLQKMVNARTQKLAQKTRDRDLNAATDYALGILENDRATAHVKGVFELRKTLKKQVAAENAAAALNYQN